MRQRIWGTSAGRGTDGAWELDGALGGTREERDTGGGARQEMEHGGVRGGDGAWGPVDQGRGEA